MVLIQVKKYFKVFLFNLLFILLFTFFINGIINNKINQKQNEIKEEVLFDLRLKLNDDENLAKEIITADNTRLKNIAKEINVSNEDNNKISIGYTFIIISFVIFLQLINYLYLRQQQKKYIKSVDVFIDSITNRKFNIRLKENDENIISNLNNRFNKLGLSVRRNYENLEKEQEKMQKALQDISHQIKTPLAALNMYNEIMIDSENLEEDNREFLELSQSQIERLNWLISSLLKIAKFESKSIQLNKENFPISKLSQDFEDILKANLTNKNLRIINTGDLDGEVNLDYKWTSEALLNIVKNATEHAFENTDIEIKYSVNVAMTKIEIINKGNLIDPDELTKIFTRFYKSNKNTNSQSIGIGLNLSKNIIDSQGGTISVQNNEDGVQFNILFLP
nr:ATP-binding protein [Helcococcus sueciensis]